MVATPIELAEAFDDPNAIRRLVLENGPYRSIASYLPPSATLGTPSDEVGADGPLPWFRSNWAVNGRADVAGADEILRNPRFLRAASQLFGGAEMGPTTVVVNVNAPMGPGAIHIDIPSFHGATRDRYSLRLLQAMGTSGLFERWRIVEAGAVSWFYDGPGGAYDYWPEGLSRAMHSRRPPYDNIALVADNDRMYHRIGWIGDPRASTPRLTPAAQIEHDGAGRWTITDAGRAVASYPDEQVRISILWKAHLLGDHVEPPLTPDRIAAIVSSALRERGIEVPTPADPTHDDDWVDLVHRIYYPQVVAGS